MAAAFLRLGISSFGGPIAHLAYFRREFVDRRRWLADEQFGNLLALCQFLPGPASSQLGFALGMLRAGWAGACAAFLAFTLPSALLMLALALYLPQLDAAIGEPVIHGLKLVALVVVSQAVIGMGRSYCVDPKRAATAVLSAAAIVLSGNGAMQIAVIVFGLVAGALFCRDARPLAGKPLQIPYARGLAILFLAVFLLLLVALPLLALAAGGFAAAASAFYRAGALVFGGGHVVLPLLQETVVAPGWITTNDFLTGYGAAQALPGPLFTVSAYLGALLPAGMGGVAGATVALISIFLPGFLILCAALPSWSRFSSHRVAANAMAGVNAAVVGILAAALYDPIWISAVHRPSDVAIAIVGFAMLMRWKLSPLVVVAWCVAAAIASHALRLLTQ